MQSTPAPTAEGAGMGQYQPPLETTRNISNAGLSSDKESKRRVKEDIDKSS